MFNMSFRYSTVPRVYKKLEMINIAICPVSHSRLTWLWPGMNVYSNWCRIGYHHCSCRPEKSKWGTNDWLIKILMVTWPQSGLTDVTGVAKLYWCIAVTMTQSHMGQRWMSQMSDVTGRSIDSHNTLFRWWMTSYTGGSIKATLDPKDFGNTF